MTSSIVLAMKWLWELCVDKSFPKWRVLSSVLATSWSSSILLPVKSQKVAHTARRGFSWQHPPGSTRVAPLILCRSLCIWSTGAMRCWFRQLVCQFLLRWNQGKSLYMLSCKFISYIFHQNYINSSMKFDFIGILYGWLLRDLYFENGLPTVRLYYSRDDFRISFPNKLYNDYLFTCLLQCTCIGVPLRIVLTDNIGCTFRLCVSTVTYCTGMHLHTHTQSQHSSQGMYCVGLMDGPDSYSHVHMTTYTRMDQPGHSFFPVQERHTYSMHQSGHVLQPAQETYRTHTCTNHGMAYILPRRPVLSHESVRTWLISCPGDMYRYSCMNQSGHGLYPAQEIQTLVCANQDTGYILPRRHGLLYGPTRTRLISCPGDTDSCMDQPGHRLNPAKETHTLVCTYQDPVYILPKRHVLLYAQPGHGLHPDHKMHVYSRDTQCNVCREKNSLKQLRVLTQYACVIWLCGTTLNEDLKCVSLQNE